MQNAVIPTILEELRFLWILAAFVLLMIPHTVDADQKNPELDQLFLQLKHSTNPYQATSLEKRIWRIWMEHPLPAITTKLMKGTQAMQLQNYDEALKYFSEFTRQVPQFAEGWNKRATVLYLLGRFHESSVDVERTLQLEPRHFGAPLWKRSDLDEPQRLVWSNRCLSARIEDPSQPSCCRSPSPIC